MKTGNQIIPNREILPLIEESIQSGVPVKLTVKGGSMAPLLRDGKDVVTLYPSDTGRLKKGDVVLFRHKNGFILHRIISISLPADAGLPGKTVLITRGDALHTTETPTLADVIAVAELPPLTGLQKARRYASFYFCKLYNRFSLLKSLCL